MSESEATNDHAAVSEIDELLTMWPVLFDVDKLAAVRRVKAEHDALATQLAEAEARAYGMRDAILSDSALAAAAKAVARIERVNGPDPNSYVRYKPIDYARAAIEAALAATDPDGGVS